MEGDITAGEDPVVRAAAVEALGNMNGTIVAIDPDSGRILAMVNQKLALSAGATALFDHQSCGGPGRAEREHHHQGHAGTAYQNLAVDLTSALAHSNNAYFEAVGRKLGFEKAQLLRASVRLG